MTSAQVLQNLSTSKTVVVFKRTHLTKSNNNKAASKRALRKCVFKLRNSICCVLTDLYQNISIQKQRNYSIHCSFGTIGQVRRVTI